MIHDDDPIRARLSRIADEGAPRLAPSARRRVLERVEREGPRTIRNTKLLRAGAFAAALAAAVAILIFVWPDAEPIATRGPACGGWPASSTYGDGIDVGRRGTVRVRGDASLERAEGCETDIALSAGRVDVNARALGGGNLRVRAGDVIVEVRGTRFSVLREGERVEVIVEEGHVVVRAPSERELHLRGGERWARGVEAAPEPETVAVVEAPPAQVVEPEPRPAPHPIVREAPPPPSPRELLALAEQAWRAGDRDRARALFEEVGTGRSTLAQSAWLRLARLELNAGEPARAIESARTYQRLFPSGALSAELLWLEADALRRSGDGAAADAVLERLRERYPGSPQARASER